MRIGELMVNKGLLTEEQVNAILDEQRSIGGAFGAIAERLFGVGEPDVEDAWAEQYALLAQHLDPRDEQPSADALELIDRRQAWQFRILPLRYDCGEVIFVTTTTHLPTALRFVIRHIETPASFALTTSEALAEALQSHYPMDGMSARFIEERGFVRDDAA